MARFLEAVGDFVGDILEMEATADDFQQMGPHLASRNLQPPQSSRSPFWYALVTSFSCLEKGPQALSEYFIS